MNGVLPNTRSYAPPAGPDSKIFVTRTRVGNMDVLKFRPQDIPEVARRVGERIMQTYFPTVGRDIADLQKKLSELNAQLAALELEEDLLKEIDVRLDDLEAAKLGIKDLRSRRQNTRPHDRRNGNSFYKGKPR